MLLRFLYLLITLLSLFGSTVAAQGGPEFVFAAGFDRGPVPENTWGLAITSHPGVTLEWQSAVKRSGDGAYHFVGGNITAGDVDIINTASNPFGGLEVWAGAGFRFESFPSTGTIWLMVPVPTDGVSGANDKPVATITPAGKLRLQNSNNANQFVQSTVVVDTGRWYYLWVHGLNGADQVQQLWIYDESGTVLEVLNLTMTVTGSFINTVAKWGQGTSGASTGLEYYMDDIVFLRGGWESPVPIRVVPKSPVGTVANGGLVTMGASDPHLAVSEFPSDDDATYIRNGATAQAHQVEFELSLANPAGNIYAIMVSVDAKKIGVKPKAFAGFRLGGQDYLSPVSFGSGYNLRMFKYLTNPATGQPWQAGEVDSLTGVVKSQAAAEFRVTNYWLDVVSN